MMQMPTKKELFKRNPYSKRPVDINEDSREYTISIAIPENTEDNTKVNVKGELLHIVVGKKKILGHEKEKVYERYFKLPNNIDSRYISAKINNGVLNITIPKSNIHKNRII